MDSPYSHTTGTSNSYRSRQLGLDSDFIISISLNWKGRVSQTSDKTDRAVVQSPQLSRVKSVILQACSNRPVTRILES